MWDLIATRLHGVTALVKVVPHQPAILADKRPEAVITSSWLNNFQAPSIPLPSYGPARPTQKTHERQAQPSKSIHDYKQEYSHNLTNLVQSPMQPSHVHSQVSAPLKLTSASCITERITSRDHIGHAKLRWSIAVEENNQENSYIRLPSIFPTHSTKNLRREKYYNSSFQTKEFGLYVFK